MHPLIKTIKQTTGTTIYEFCEKELKTEYKAFIARLNKGKLYPSEIFYIVHRTKKSLTEIFGKDWKELVIVNQGGDNIAGVQKIIDNLTPKQEREMIVLLGFDKNSEKEPDRHKKKVEEVPEQVKKYPLTPKEATEEKPKDKLSSIFVNIY